MTTPWRFVWGVFTVQWFLYSEAHELDEAKRRGHVTTFQWSMLTIPDRLISITVILLLVDRWLQVVGGPYSCVVHWRVFCYLSVSWGPRPTMLTVYAVFGRYPSISRYRSNAHVDRWECTQTRRRVQPSCSTFFKNVMKLGRLSKISGRLLKQRFL